MGPNLSSSKITPNRSHSQALSTQALDSSHPKEKGLRIGVYNLTTTTTTTTTIPPTHPPPKPKNKNNHNHNNQPPTTHPKPPTPPHKSHTCKSVPSTCYIQWEIILITTQSSTPGHYPTECPTRPSLPAQE